MKNKIFLVFLLLIIVKRALSIEINHNNCFIENKGQLHDQYNNKRNDIISFVEGEKYNCYIKPNGISYQLYKGFKKDGDTNQYLNLNRIDFQYLNTSSNTKTELSNLNKDYINYYLDSNEKGITNVKTAKELLIHDLYNKIDLKYYFKEANLEYDFIVKPNGNINDIKIKIDGSKSLKIDKAGNLIISTINGDLVQNKPIAWQENKIIETKWVIRNDDVGLIIEAYDHSKTLIIDPLVKQWGTYYMWGNSDNSSISRDSLNNLIFSSYTNNTNSLLITSGSYQTTIQGGIDVLISKFNSLGNRLWSTYFGGNNGEDNTSNCTDKNGNIYITGSTYSTNGISTANSYLTSYPSGIYQSSYLSKFNSNGLLIWSTYIGGNTGTTNAYSCRADNNNNIYISGNTVSTYGISNTNSFLGSIDVFLMKFNSNGNRIYGKYIGGYSWENTNRKSLYIDKQNNIYLSGETSTPSGSNNIGTLNGYQNYIFNSGNYSTPFLIKFDSLGSKTWGTYYNSGYNGLSIYNINCIADNLGNSYLYGTVTSSNNQNFTTANSYQSQWINSINNGYTIQDPGNGFLVKFSNNCARIYATYLGGELNEVIRSCDIDTSGNIYITGQTSSISYISTFGAINSNYKDSTDGFLMKFDTTGNRIWGTYIGDVGFEDIHDIVVNNDNTIYIAGKTASLNNISSTGAIQSTKIGSGNTVTNGFIFKIGDCSIPSPIVQFSNNGIICNNNPVILSTAANSNYTYQWKLNGNNISGATSNLYSTTIIGNYTVEISNAAGCKSESNSLNIASSTIVATITNYNINTICQGNSVTLYAPTGYVFYQWRNNGINIIGANTNTLNVAQSGTYSAIIMSSNYCSAVSNDINITVNNNPIASISAMGPSSFCTGNSVVLSAQTAPGNIYNWRLNGVLISGANTATYIANTSGIYDVVVTNSSNCSTISNAITLTEIANPVVPITSSGPTSFCQGNSVVLSTTLTTGNSYQWKYNGTLITNATNNNYTASTAGTYQVIVTNSSNCSASNQITITNYTNPTTSILPSGPTSLCQGNSVQLNATVTPGYTYTFNWKLNGNTISGASSNIYTANQFGNYTVTITDINNCSATSQVLIVTQLPQPLATISSNNITSACQGDSILLSSNTNSNYSYQWKLNGNAITNATNSTFKAFQTGTYSIDITNSNNCTSVSNSIPISIYPKPIAILNASGSTNFCIGNYANLITPAQNNVTYQWLYNGNIIIGSNLNNYSAYQQGDYKVKITNQQGCETLSNPITITTYPIPSSTIIAQGNLTICEGDSVKLKTTNSNANYSYQWKFYSTNITNAIDTQYQAKQSGIYSIVTSNGNCSSISNQITVNTIPIPNAQIFISGKTILCQGDTCSLSTTQSSSYTYQWYLNNNAIPMQVNNTIKIGIPGVYKVSINDGNCINTSNFVSINVKPIPSPTIQFLNGILSCSNGNYTNYKWYLNNVLLLNATTSSFYPTANGTYKVQVLEDSCWGQSQDFYLSNLYLNNIDYKKLKCYPNPTHDIIFIEGIDIEKIKLYNINGQFIDSFEKTNHINITKYPSGNYIIKIFDTNNQLIAIEKISKI
jgi:hypothetical protein